jgi:hypothetical protein
MTIRWTTLRVGALTVALLALLTACEGGTPGRTSGTTPVGDSEQATATARTNQPVTPSHNSASCQDPAAVIAGDLRVSPTALGPNGLGYGPPPVLQVPDGTPLQPLALPVRGANGHASREIPGWFSPAGDAPPDLLITVCNTSTTRAHDIDVVSVRLSAFTPYSGSMNIWDPCAGTYTRPAGVVALECGETAAIYDEYVRATFAANAQVGAIVPAPLADPTSYGALGPLSATLPPGQSLVIAVFVTAPAAAGVYTFAAGITADTASLPFTVGQNMLLAPIAHRWTGKACLSPSMQAEIPANPPAETYYICPES